jgi:DNA processing protein
LKQYFPARNRIISGVSDAVLLIEAKRKSGALITAKFAFSQARKVIVVPGNIFSKQSQGINDLFNKGALPAQSPEEILKILFGWKRLRAIKRSQNKDANAPSNLSSEEKLILNNIPFDLPITASLIIRQTKMSSAKVIAILTQLEIDNLIESGHNSGYIRI